MANAVRRSTGLSTQPAMPISSTSTYGDQRRSGRSVGRGPCWVRPNDGVSQAATSSSTTNRFDRTASSTEPAAPVRWTPVSSDWMIAVPKAKPIATGALDSRAAMATPRVSKMTSVRVSGANRSCGASSTPVSVANMVPTIQPIRASLRAGRPASSASLRSSMTARISGPPRENQASPTPTTTTNASSIGTAVDMSMPATRTVPSGSKEGASVRACSPQIAVATPTSSTVTPNPAISVLPASAALVCSGPKTAPSRTRPSNGASTPTTSRPAVSLGRCRSTTRARVR